MKTVEENLLSQLKIMPNGCWEYQGCTDDAGYGRIGSGERSKTARAHRKAYEFWVGPLDPEEQVCHSCDNPPCCNPKHLFLGDHAANAADRNAKGRTACGERHGSAKLTATEVLEIRIRRAAGETGRALAAEFKVSPAMISMIHTKTNWKHI